MRKTISSVARILGYMKQLRINVKAVVVVADNDVMHSPI